MKSARRLSVWCLALAACVASGWWIIHVPYRPGAVVRALPADATAVGLHRDLGGRWDQVMGNPAVSGVLASGGGSSMMPWLRRAAGREMAWARVPFPGWPDQQALVAVSWLGGRSQMLRWWFTFFPPSGFEAKSVPPGDTYWVNASKNVQVTFFEGLLVACMATDHDLMAKLVETHRGRWPSMGDGNGDVAGLLSLTDPDAPDRGWFRLASAGTESWPPPFVTFELTRIDEAGLSGRLRAPSPIAYPPYKVQSQELAAMRESLGVSPMALFCIEPSVAQSVLGGLKDPTWGEAIADLAGARSGGLLLAVLDETCSGRYKGVKVPTAVLGLNVDSPDQGVQRMTAALDRFNARHQWGLVLRKRGEGEPPIHGVEKTVPLESQDLEMNERPACMVVSNLMLVASNLQGLERLRGQSLTSERGEEWGGGLAEKPAAVYGWLDLSRAAKTLRTLVMLYSSKLAAGNPADAQIVRERMRVVTRWITAFERIGAGELRFRGDGQTMELAFTWGEAE